MARFVPCQGKSACRDDGARCLTCGRSLEEITRLRELLEQITALALDYGYENSAEYSAYVGRKVEKMIAHRRAEENHAQPD